MALFPDTNKYCNGPRASCCQQLEAGSYLAPETSIEGLMRYVPWCALNLLWLEEGVYSLEDIRHLTRISSLSFARTA